MTTKLLPIKLGPLAIRHVARRDFEPKEHKGAIAITVRGTRKITYLAISLNRAYRLDKLR